MKSSKGCKTPIGVKGGSGHARESEGGGTGSLNDAEAELSHHHLLQSPGENSFSGSVSSCIGEMGLGGVV